MPREDILGGGGVNWLAVEHGERVEGDGLDRIALTRRARTSQGGR
ncbi:hypothetical protein [Mycolicibacterium hodleri]|nr:hypothetical protein [Mycolicibacterium hodleri]